MFSRLMPAFQGLTVVACFCLVSGCSEGEASRQGGDGAADQQYFGIYQVEFYSHQDETTLAVEFRKGGASGKVSPSAAAEGVVVSGTNLNLVRGDERAENAGGIFLARVRGFPPQSDYVFSWRDSRGQTQENSIAMATPIALCMDDKNLTWRRRAALEIQLCEPGKQIGERVILQVTELSDNGRPISGTSVEFDVPSGQSFSISSAQTGCFRRDALRVVAIRERFTRPEHGHDKHGGVMRARYFSHPIILNHSARRS